MGQEPGQTVVVAGLDQLVDQMVSMTRRQEEWASGVTRRLDAIDGEVGDIRRALLGDLDDESSVGLRGKIAALEAKQRSLCNRLDEQKEDFEGRLKAQKESQDTHNKALWGIGTGLVLTLVGAFVSAIFKVL